MGRTPCCDKAGLKKGPWTSEEDQKLTDFIQKNGPGNWRSLPKKAGLQRCGKSCRLRWANYLRPDIKRGGFSLEEEETIIQLHSVLGNKWSTIAAKLPGRTDNEIKNYWNTHIRKRLLRMGIDPVTHGPRFDFLDLPSILSSLQNPSLLSNMSSALLNMQTLLNPELLRLASTFTNSQNGVPNSLSHNSLQSCFASSALAQNPLDPRAQMANQIKHETQNFESFGAQERPSLEEELSRMPPLEPNVCGFQMKDHVSMEPSFNCYAADHETIYPSTDNTAFMSNNNSGQSVSNNSSFSSVFSTPCSSPANPLQFLDSCTSSEDEIERYFSNMVKKLENPAILNPCIS